MTRPIAWLPGDGIGPEVLSAVRIVLDRLGLDAEYVHGDIGWECWRREGDPLPRRTIDLLKTVDVAMFGAITSKPAKQAETELDASLQGKGMSYRSPIVRLRQLFDLYICLRPCAAFDFARTRGRKKVTIAHKVNVVRASDGLFLETAREVAAGYPEILVEDANVDAAAMWLLKNPHNYDVLLAPNLYGDILSDLCAQMVGGLGFGCSGNIGERLAVFEPTHGSAPKYAGKNKVNPIAAILAAKMMLEHMGETEMANRLESAVAAVIREGKTRTYDMGGMHTTHEMAGGIADKL